MAFQDVCGCDEIEKNVMESVRVSFKNTIPVFVINNRKPP
jgi:hypothetical protein